MNMNKEPHTNTDKKSKGFKPLKYIGMMGACCLLPIIILSVLPFLQLSNLGANRALLAVVPFICPIVMGLMMFGLLKDSKGRGCCSHKDKEEVTSEKSE